MGPSPAPALTACFTHAGLSQHRHLNVSLLGSCARTQVYWNSAERPSTLAPHSAAPC